MAFPSLISTLVDPYHGVGGPFVSSTGNVYVLTRSSSGQEIHMFKATDPASGWAGAGTDPSMTSGNTVRYVSAYQVSDVIHVVTRDAAGTTSNQLRYHAFDMATDAWTTTNQLVKTTFTQKSAVDESPLFLLVRSDGNKIVFYEGPQVLADIQRSRVYYARHMGSAWSADIALDSGGNVDWIPVDARIGKQDIVHFNMLNLTGAALHYRSLTSANSLETMPSSYWGSIPHRDAALQQGVAHSASAGGTIVRFPFLATIGTSVAVEAYFDSSSVPASVGFLADPTTPGVPDTGAVRKIMAYVADGMQAYSIFINSSQDLALQSDVAFDWSDPVTIQAASASYVNANIYTRAASRVIGIVYRDGPSDLSYTEYTLSVGSTSAVSKFSLGMLGIGR